MYLRFSYKELSYGQKYLEETGLPLLRQWMLSVEAKESREHF
jgi:hypothetical protein